MRTFEPSNEPRNCSSFYVIEALPRLDQALTHLQAHWKAAQWAQGYFCCWPWPPCWARSKASVLPSSGAATACLPLLPPRLLTAPCMSCSCACCRPAGLWPTHRRGSLSPSSQPGALSALCGEHLPGHSPGPCGRGRAGKWRRSPCPRNGQRSWRASPAGASTGPRAPCCPGRPCSCSRPGSRAALAVPAGGGRCARSDRRRSSR